MKGGNWVGVLQVLRLLGLWLLFKGDRGRDKGSSLAKEEEEAWGTESHSILLILSAMNVMSLDIFAATALDWVGQVPMVFLKAMYGTEGLHQGVRHLR